MQTSFIHLRVSSEFSISRGLLRINEIVDNAKKLKMPAVALSDLNNMEPNVDRTDLIQKYTNFFKMKKLEIDKEVLAETSNLQLLSTLAMLAPFNKIDKQAILESPNISSRINTINSILDLNTFQVVSNNNTNQLN